MLDTREQAECIAKKVAREIVDRRPSLAAEGIGTAEIQLYIEPIIKEELDAIKEINQEIPLLSHEETAY